MAKDAAVAKTGNGGPPNKFPTWVVLTGNPAADAVALSAAYQNFQTAYNYWPTVAIAVGNVVFLGAYGN